MGANLSGGRAGRLCRRTAWPRQHWSAKETAKGCRRRSAGRSAAIACGERLPKKFASLGFGRRATPARKTLVVQKLRQKYSLNLLLSIAQLPRATFYYHLKQMQKEDKYASVKEEITTIYHENRGRYGYRRITAELRKRTFSVNHKTVQRLMKELGLPCQDEEVSLQTETDRISGLLQQPQDQGKAKGLAACNSQTASPLGCLNNFYFKILSNFWGSLHCAAGFFYFCR